MVDLKPEGPEDDMAKASSEFARWVDLGTRASLVLLVAGFLAYVTGLMPPHVPFDELPKLWGLPFAEFAQAAGTPRGWAWLSHTGRGDYFNYVGIALLATIVIAAYLRILPSLLRRERAFAVIALLEVVVLLAAASGLLNSISGGH